MSVLRPLWLGCAIAAGLALSACGGDRKAKLGQEVTRGADPVVAATVNGKPIYVDDVNVEATVRDMIQLGEQLDPASDEFFQVLQDLIETRLMSMEAEARGLDKAPDVKHRLDIARERILANVLNETMRDSVLTDAAIKRFYRENAKLLGKGALVRASHIVVGSREAALGAKSRIDRGEGFEKVAFEISTDRDTAGQGGDLGFRVPESFPDSLQEVMKGAAVGSVNGPVQSDMGWHLIKIEDRKTAEAPSLESMRRQIEDSLWWPEQRRVVERLRASARIELFIDEERTVGATPQGDMTAPADGGADEPSREDGPTPMGPAGAAGEGFSALPPAGGAAKAAPAKTDPAPPEPAKKAAPRPAEKPAPKPSPAAPMDLRPGDTIIRPQTPPAAPAPSERET